MDVWVEQKLQRGVSSRQRLKARLGTLLTAFGQRVRGTVRMARQDWAATKAADRFFDNPRVDEGAILAGHFGATAARFAAAADPVRASHDTTEFGFQPTPRRGAAPSPSSRGATPATRCAGC